MAMGDLLDRVVYFYRTHFLSLIAYSALFTIPIVFLSTLATLPNFALLSNLDLLEESPELIGSTLSLGICASSLLGVVSSFLLVPLEAAGIGVAMHGFLLEQRQVSLAEMFAGMRARLGPLLGTGFLAMFVSALLFFTFIIPPVGMAVWTLFYMAFFISIFVVLYEGRQGTMALKRGWALVRGSVWRVLGYLFLLYVFSLIFGGIIGALLGVLDIFLIEVTQMPMISLITQSISQIVVNTLITPLTFGAAALLYFDLRSRHEGLDVALSAAEAAGEPLDLAEVPVEEVELFGEESWRAIGLLSAIFTGFFALLCGCIAIPVFLSTL